MKIKHLLLGLALALGSYHCQSPKGTEAQVGEAQAVPETTAEKEITVDVQNSKIKWMGFKVTGRHEGTIKLQSGTFKMRGDTLIGGEFIIDMKSIEVTDLKGEDKKKLESHLKTKDFFLVDSFPIGKFVITKVQAAPTDSTTHIVTGNLTLKNIEKSVSFPVKLEPAKGAFIAKAKSIKIDRTLWGITYKGMADNAIKNEILFDLLIMPISSTPPPAQAH
ncbi:MAG: YceI family protein [Bacteroidia bacterium]|nr:YceI family protein [Bacteroidia bacterium]MDW8158043.1 YceI family protein [Bacteroidia bacterium]